MKYLPSILASVILTFSFGVFVVQAAGYIPLVNLPGVTSTEAPANIGAYLSGMLKLIIALGGALAILMAIIAGTKYVAAGISPSAKSDAKSDLANAFIGLTLILTSYLLLNSINPKLVEFNFGLPTVAVEKQAAPGALANTWADDSAVRSVLSNQTSIGFNNPNCANVYDTGCTSVFGLDGNAISGLRNLYTKCKQYSLDGTCNITINGGTEFWLHKSHNDQRKVDLAHGGSRSLDYYIKKNGVANITNCGVPTDPHYQPDGPSGGIYVDEPNRDDTSTITGTGHHWHVCY